MRNINKLLIVSTVLFAVPGMSQVSKNREAAKKLLERISSTKVAMDHPLLDEVESRIARGDWIGAAEISQQHPDFLNTTVKLMALKMSTREETFVQPLNDFAASFIGVTRDQTDARELLYGNFYYRASEEFVTEAATRNINIRSGPADFTRSNNHYTDLDNPARGIDIGAVLTRVNGQVLRGANDESTRPNPDPAGVLTSRAFMTAHALMGTNRRLVEFTFRQFMCVPMEEWADTTASDKRIGRDIDRFPGNDHNKFLTTCKGCHTVMDGFRGAFAYWDTANGGNSATVANSPRPKMNQNNTTYPSGFTTVNNSFVNNARGPANSELFGWRGDVEGGNGVGDFGRMVSNSKRFSQCMVKRVYESVCRQDLVAKFNMPYLKEHAAKFESSGYNLKKLYQEVAVSNLCQGK